MAVQKAAIAIPFAGGIETKQDPKQVPGAKLLDLQNAVFTRQTTLSKRNGYRSLGLTIDGSAGVTIPNPRGLARRDGELLAFTDSHAYSYRPSSDSWSDTGQVACVVTSDSAIARTGTQQTMPDLAQNGGATAIAWEDNRGGVWYSVTETTTGRELVPPTQGDSLGQRPRCLAVGSFLHILWARPTAGRIYILVIDPRAPVAGTPAIFTEDLSASDPSFDAETALATIGTGAGVAAPGLIAWRVDGFTSGGYRVAWIHPSGVIGSPANHLPSAATYLSPMVAGTGVAGPIGVHYDAQNGTNVIVAFSIGLTSTTRTMACRVLDAADFSAWPGPADPTTLDGTVGDWRRVAIAFAAVPSGKRWLWWAADYVGASDDLNIVRSGAIDTDAAAVLSPTVSLRGHTLVSRAWNDGYSVTPSIVADRTSGDVYVVVSHAVLFFPYYAAVRISAGVGAAVPLAARLQPSLATGAPTRMHTASVVGVDADPAGILPTTTASRKWRTALGYRIQLSSANGDQFGEQGIRDTTLDFHHAAAWQTAQLGRGLYLAAAAPLHYDGDRWSETDFPCAPDTATGVIATSQATGGNLTNPGSYLYRVWYEEIDGDGEIHPGPVSPGTLVAMTASNTKVTLTIPTLRLTRKRRVRIGVARSPVNQTGTIDQIPFYRVSSTDPNAVGDNGYVLNDPTVDTVTFTDAFSDTVLLTKEPLYTNGGILSNDPSPWAGGVVAGGKNRLYWTDPSDPNLVRFSQEIRDDTGLEAPSSLSIKVHPYGGAIVGLAVLDDVVIVLKETAIYAFAGPGPAAAPDLDPQAGFSPAALVTSDAGCSDTDSIALTPSGIMFKSAKGYLLLDRGRQIQRIGNPVYAYNGQTVTRTILLPDRPQVIWLTADTGGRALLYDYERDQWSTFTNHLALDGIVVSGAFYYLRPDGRVFAETIGTYKDDNEHIPMRIETAWLRMTGYLQGWHRFWHALFLGTYKSAHTLRVRFKVNYQEAWTAPFDLNVNSNYDPSLYGVGSYGVGQYGGPGGASGPVYQRRIHVGKQAQAIAFRIEDVEATADYGAAFELSELLLTGGIIRADFPLGADRSS